MLGDHPVAYQRNGGHAGAEDQGAGLQEEQSQDERGSARRRETEEGPAGEPPETRTSASCRPLVVVVSICVVLACAGRGASIRSTRIPAARIMGTKFGPGERGDGEDRGAVDGGAATAAVLNREREDPMNCLIRYLALMFQLFPARDLALWETELTAPTMTLTSSACRAGRTRTLRVNAPWRSGHGPRAQAAWTLHSRLSVPRKRRGC